MLAQLNGDLAKAEVQNTSGGEFPDGNYLVRIQKADLVPVKTGPNVGKPQVEWWLRVMEGPAGTVNRVVFHYHRLYGDDPDKVSGAVGRFKTDLSRIGQEIETFEQLPAILAVLIASETKVRISLKTGTAGIQNTYFNGVVA